jgi:tRNA threonylcarbamoyladenosine biosynthesis protein TsaE
MNKKWKSNSAAETGEIARQIGLTLKGGEVLALVGDLGAGKTTFTQALAETLGVKGRVKSPTYTVLQEYVVEGGGPIKRFIHLDLYRFQKVEELGALELEEYRNEETVMVIEWPEKVGLEVLKPSMVIKIEHVLENERLLELTY